MITKSVQLLITLTPLQVALRFGLLDNPGSLAFWIGLLDNPGSLAFWIA